MAIFRAPLMNSSAAQRMQHRLASFVAPSTQLVRTLYCPTFLDVPPVEVIAEVIRSGGTAYAWIDGLDRKDPILVPTGACPRISDFGPVGQYLDRHADLVHEVVDAAQVQGVKLSVALLVRCVETMLGEEVDAHRAVEIGVRWANVLLELDEAERQAFNAAFAEASGELRAAEESALAAAQASALECQGAYER